jgi:hypothetical protein
MAMNDEERSVRAVSLIRKQLTPDFMNIYRYAMEQDQSDEVFLRRAGIGTAIRNLLAQEGIFWEEVAMAEVWLRILLESTKEFPNPGSGSIDGRKTTIDVDN